MKMERDNKIKLLSEILGVETTEIYEKKKLADFADWDSFAILSFIVMMDEEFGREISGDEVRKLVTVEDALNVMA